MIRLPAPRPIPPFAFALLAALAGVCEAAPIPAEASVPAADSALAALPLFDPEFPNPAGGFHAYRFEVRVRRDALAADVRGLRIRERFGNSALDALIGRFGAVRIEPEFPHAVRPPEGSPLEDLTEFFVVHLPRGAVLAEAISAFRAAPEVKSADPIGVFPLERIPSDSLFTSQWPLDEENDRDSDFPEAWDFTTGDTTIVIAIVDSGVLWSHPDLAGPAPFTGGNIWHNWVEVGGVPGVDDDGNGFVDDFRGWDFVDGVPAATGEDGTAADNDPSDFDGHGTLVAGIAGARTDNVSGVAGGAWNTKIMALRVGWRDALTGTGFVDMSYCANAIDYATRMGARVINCSWTNANQQGLGAAVSNAIAAGISVVVAAGNQGTQTPPKNYLAQRGDCVDVGSIDIYDNLDIFSNYGTWLDVCAGGHGVRSTHSSEYQADYASGTGTSFSAPHVSAAIALYQSYRRAQGLPLATPDEVLLRVRDTADRIDDVNSAKRGLLGGGRLNAWRMIADPPTTYRVALPGGSTTSPAIVDWGPEGQATVVGTLTGHVVAVDAVGAPLPNWPVALGSALFGHPAVWDVDFDGTSEIVIGDSDGKLHALREDGSEAAGWPVTLGGGVWAGPAIADVAGDPAYEIVVGTTDPNRLHVLDRHGVELPGWPVDMPAPLDAGPALGDLDEDDQAEIVIGDVDSLLHVYRGDGTPYPGWPFNIGGAVHASPSIGDIDGDGHLDIVVGSSLGAVHVYSAAGIPHTGFPAVGGGWVLSAPALANLDADPQLEIAFGTEQNAVVVRDDDGEFFTFWGRLTGGAVRGSVLIGDLDGDGAFDIVAPSGDGAVHAWDLDAVLLTGYPRPSGGPITSGATLGDPDGDGRLELCFGNDNAQLHSWDLGPGSFDPTRIAWATVGGNMQRTGRVGLTSIGVPLPQHRTPRLTMSPNPARARSVARASFPERGGERVHFALFDVAGRVRRTHDALLDGAGNASWAVERPSELAAGVYFVRAKVADLEQTAKWVRLR